ncbi:hypothetical protein [Actinomyces minihominis]|uniref:hypothetical protein n=1 Tax=Actinomyces minihominis TaxID=2002838 RepID=UPI00101AD205|nr:hypothetical protein [Actinomyces minihominis]
MEISSDSVHEACARLRFSEGLRRRWREARAEAALREASNLCFVDGLRMPVEELRLLVASEVEAADLSPTEAQALGVWRAVWEVEQMLAPLNQAGPVGSVSAPLAVPALLAKINRNVCSYMVAGGYLEAGSVAVPRDASVLSRFLRMVGGNDGPALERVARAWRMTAAERLFEVGSGATGVIFAKWMLAQTGVEPTGVAVLSAWPSQNRSAYLAAAGPDGDATDWESLVNLCIIEGCAVGEQISRSIQVGKINPSTGQ